jgi:hypothetical protein
MLDWTDAAVLCCIVVCTTVYTLNKKTSPTIVMHHAPLPINETLDIVFKRMGWEKERLSDVYIRLHAELQKVVVVVDEKKTV